MKKQYRFWTYDVWGNEEEGYTVNDRLDNGYLEIRMKKNWGEPSDRQLTLAVGGKGLTWESNGDGVFYASAKDGYPVCELVDENWED